jgi:NADH-quinone oxidoreductase subunit M
MEALMVGVFAAQDLFLFYVFFEGGLIPMYLIIGIWGGADRIKASYKFFLYTFLGSVLMLIAMIYMAVASGTTSIPQLMVYDFSPQVQQWLWLAFLASFAVKLPMWPVHTWLPDAHVQAPTAGSVILAGILLKLGAYGFVRFSLPMFPDASAQFMPLMFTLSGIAIVYTSLVALVQKDMKKLIAYSSVAHMGFVTFGLFALNRQGIEGALIVMLSHGLVSGALFLVVGVIYDRMHTREIAMYGGLSNNMPGYALLFMLFTMASVGLPGTSGFVGEFLSLMGTYQASTWGAIAGTTGIILGACYSLYLYWRICFGEARTAEAAAMPDLSMREWWLLGPIAIGVLWMGVYPESFLAPMRNDVGYILQRVDRVAPAGDSRPTAGRPPLKVVESGAAH